MTKITHPQQLEGWKSEILQNRPQFPKTVVISSGTCGQASGSLPVIERFREELKKRGLDETYSLLITGCHGPCQFEPNIIIVPDNIFYKNLTPDDVP